MNQTRISIHLGAHCTDEDLLVKSLLKNVKVLSDVGVAVPGPGRYRQLIRSVMEKLKGARASQDPQDVLFEEILDTEEPERVILSHENFICPHPGALKSGQLYPQAGNKTKRLRDMFPDNPMDFFIAVRNPATFIPALHHRVQPGPFQDFIAGSHPDTLVWADMIRDIRTQNPDVPVTVWCNEDTPLIWPEVMHEVAGLEPRVQLMGGFDILSQIMAKEGIKRLRTYLASHPPATEIQRRRVLAAFLDKYAIEDEVEEVLDLPGWTPEIVEHLTAVYDDDMIEIGRIPGVTLLTA